MAGDDANGLRPDPSLLEKAKNFATSVTQHVVAGLPRLSEKDVDARLAVCQACPQFDGHSCRLCGCNMRIKASWAEQKCPLGKWPGEGNYHEMVEQASGRDQESG